MELVIENNIGLENRIKAKGCIAASLHWADENGVLPDWQPFAYIPIEPNGVGVYKMDGGRAVPAEATHVLARAVSADFTGVEEVLAKIPGAAERTEETSVQRFLVMTDLHLSNKPWQVRKALSMAKDFDAVLIAGDMTNDGTRMQLERFWGIAEELAANIPVFAVAGNHDYPKDPLPFIVEGICEYPYLQRALLERAENMGISVYQDISGAYAAVMGDTAIIGLNESGKPFIFLSGHTHVSMNCSCGCVDRDDSGNIYINAGSIRPTALKSDVPLQTECWTEGNVVELLISENQTMITGISMKTGQRISRGHYFFTGS